jgi:hypothetical protein
MNIMILEDRKGFTRTEQVPLFPPVYHLALLGRVEAIVKGVNDPIFTDVKTGELDFYAVGPIEKIGVHNIQRYKER